jgi:hypothetical protein
MDVISVNRRFRFGADLPRGETGVSDYTDDCDDEYTFPHYGLLG